MKSTHPNILNSSSEKTIKNNYIIKSEVFLYPGMTGWHFISIPKKQSEEIKKSFGNLSRGWGSLPIIVTIGKTKWKTSIFPDKKSGTYLLPLKAEIRKIENIYSGDIISFSIKIQV